MKTIRPWEPLSKGIAFKLTPLLPLHFLSAVSSQRVMCCSVCSPRDKWMDGWMAKWKDGRKASEWGWALPNPTHYSLALPRSVRSSARKAARAPLWMDGQWSRGGGNTKGKRKKTQQKLRKVGRWWCVTMPTKKQRHLTYIYLDAFFPMAMCWMCTWWRKHRVPYCFMPEVLETTSLDSNQLFRATGLNTRNAP